MADKPSLDIPDLDLPPISGRPASRPSAHKVEIEMPPAANADELDMELERGGGGFTQQPVSSTRASGQHPSAGTRPSQPRMSAASGIEVAYRRMDAQKAAAAPRGPGTLEKILSWIVPFGLAAGTVLALVKTVHRRGGRNFMALLPHAFDASSTVQSGAFALTALVLAITLGVIAFRLEPRSYAMVGSSTMLVLTSLAMVTVTLVSLEEHRSPADGALLIPYLVPLAILLLGLGIAGRGPSRFLGGDRAIAALVGVAGGTLGFVAIELSKLARLLP